MNLAEDIKPISYVKANAAEIITKITKTRRSLVITQNGEAKAVLTDIESYSQMKDTLAMLKLVALGREDVKQGRITEHSEFKKQMRAILQDKKEQLKK